MTTRKTEKPATRKSTRPQLKAIAPDAAAPPEATEQLVTCFMSGRTVPRSEAVLVKLGPGQRVWMLPEFCNNERDRNRAG